MKTGGRQAGTQNKVTATTKDIISKCTVEYFESGLLMADFKELEPKDRINVAVKLISIITPKAINVAPTKVISIEDTLAKLAEEGDALG